MKKLIAILVFLFIGLTANAETSTNYYKWVGGYFYTNLTPYGTWIEIDYGVVAWRPTIIKRNWAPYKIGRWIWTDYGWYWDSYEPFGHIVFHYGRWYYDDYYGWIWIPDDEWAPAWVEWRYDDDYIGWAPLHPYAVFSVNFGIRITYEYYVPYTHWHFVTYRNFCDPYVYNYYVPAKHKYRIYSRTKERYDYRYYNGRVRNEGVDFDLIRNRSGQKIEKRDLITSNDPREFENIKRRDDNRIRTFIADRNEIQRDRESLREVKIERSDRRPNIEIEKVELTEIKRNRINDRNDLNRQERIDQRRDTQKEEKVRERSVLDERNKNRNNDFQNREDKNRSIEQEKSRSNESRNTERRRDTQIESRTERDRDVHYQRKDLNQNTDKSFELRKNETKTEQNRIDVRKNEQLEKKNFEQRGNENKTQQMKRSDSDSRVDVNRNQTRQQNRSDNSRQNTQRIERTR